MALYRGEKTIFLYRRSNPSLATPSVMRRGEMSGEQPLWWSKF